MESFKIVNECHARFLGRFLDDRRLLGPVAAVDILVVTGLTSVSLLPKRHVEELDLFHFNIQVQHPSHYPSFEIYSTQLITTLFTFGTWRSCTP